MNLTLFRKQFFFTGMTLNYECVFCPTSETAKKLGSTIIQ